MPELKLSNHKSTDPILRSIAVLEVKSLMYFYDDLSLQKDFLISEVAEFLELAAKNPKAFGYKKVTSYDLAKKYLEPLGGLKTLNKSMGEKQMKENLKIRYRNGGIAGSVLNTIEIFGRLDFEIKKDAISIRKAKWLAKEALADTENPLEERMISTIWEKTKPVAHLWASYLKFVEDDLVTAGVSVPIDALCPGGLADFLSEAEYFRDFGDNYIPHGQKHPILSHVDSWTFPESTIPYPWKKNSSYFYPINEGNRSSINFVKDLYKKTFKDYKAPKS